MLLFFLLYPVLWDQNDAWRDKSLTYVWRGVPWWALVGFEDRFSLALHEGRIVLFLAFFGAIFAGRPVTAGRILFLANAWEINDFVFAVKPADVAPHFAHGLLKRCFSTFLWGLLTVLAGRTLLCLVWARRIFLPQKVAREWL